MALADHVILNIEKAKAGGNFVNPTDVEEVLNKFGFAYGVRSNNDRYFMAVAELVNIGLGRVKEELLVIMASPHPDVAAQTAKLQEDIKKSVYEMLTKVPSSAKPSHWACLVCNPGKQLERDGTCYTCGDRLTPVCWKSSKKQVSPASSPTVAWTANGIADLVYYYGGWDVEVGSPEPGVTRISYKHNDDTQAEHLNKYVLKAHAPAGMRLVITYSVP